MVPQDQLHGLEAQTAMIPPRLQISLIGFLALPALRFKRTYHAKQYIFTLQKKKKNRKEQTYMMKRRKLFLTGWLRFLKTYNFESV